MLSWMSQNMARISDDTAARDAVERKSKDDRRWVELVRGLSFLPIDILAEAMGKRGWLLIFGTGRVSW